MTPDPRGLLGPLLLDPQRAAEIPLEQIPSVLAALAAVQGTLAARMMATPPAESRRPEPPSVEDRLLTVKAAAAIAGVSPKWLYRHAPALPFTRRLSPATLRVSEAGLRRWLDARKA